MDTVHHFIIIYLLAGFIGRYNFKIITTNYSKSNANPDGLLSFQQLPLTLVKRTAPDFLNSELNACRELQNYKEL